MYFESKILAKKYAVAFLNIFSDKLKISDCDACENAANYLQNNRSFIVLLQAPFISKKIKTEALKKMLDHFLLPSVIEKITDLLRVDKRLSLLPDVLMIIAQEYRARNDYVIFSIESAHALSKKDTDVVTSYLQRTTGKKIISTFKNNDALIAGLRLQSSTLLWEYSIRKQLQAIKKKFVRQELNNGY